MANETWPTEWIRGTLAMLVLAAMVDGPTYGYAIASALEKQGLGKVKGGTLYPLLGRLETDSYITSRWEPGQGGPGRKFFEITPAGVDHLDANARRWGEFAGLVRGMLAGAAAPPERGTT